MRSQVFALIVCSFGCLSACGDNLSPDMLVETQVGSTTLAAGDPVVAQCTIVNSYGDPVLDKDGNSLTESTEFAIDYEAPDSFATDTSEQVVAARVGMATVRCSAPSLALVDETAEQLTITPGPPVRVLTKLEKLVTVAGQPDGATCVAFDAFDNPVAPAEHAFSLSPSGAGTTTTAIDVTADVAGEYEVSCVVMGAAEVEPATMVVIPALPAAIAGVLDPARTVYAVFDQVTLIASVFDHFGNRVDDVTFDYTSSPNVPSPALARFRFAQDGNYLLTAAVTSATENNVPLSVTLPADVDSSGPIIDCMHVDTPNVASDAYMIQQAPSTVMFPVRISGPFTVSSVTIGGNSASVDSNGNYSAAVPFSFGMNFIDVVATDNKGVQNSKTCFVLAGTYFSSESTTMAGALALRLDPYAIGDPDTSGLNSLNDLFHTVLSSSALRTLVDAALVAANPINDGGCGVFACNPDVNYNSGSIVWDTPDTTLSLISGGLRAYVHLPNVALTVRACGTTCCIGGSTIKVTASYIDATVDFSLTLSGGLVRTAVSGSPSVTVGTVTLNGSGFCGFIINLVQSFFTGTVKNAVQSSLSKFINNNVGPMLDQITSSLDISTLAQSFNVPRLDGNGTVALGFSLAFTSLTISTTRALIGIGTKFSPGGTVQSRPSLGIARRTSNPLLDPPGTSTTRPVGISAYEGLLNEVLHALWRGGYFQANLSIGGGTAAIDSWLPPVAVIGANNTAELMLGGVYATLTIPGLIDQPIQIMFGGHATAAVAMSGNDLTFGSLNLDQLYVSFRATLTQNQRDAMENFLTSALSKVLGDALNNGLPAFPIPSFTLPASVATYGLPAGAKLGIVNPVLSTSSAHCVLDGGFGVQ